MFEIRYDLHRSHSPWSSSLGRESKSGELWWSVGVVPLFSHTACAAAVALHRKLDEVAVRVLCVAVLRVMCYVLQCSLCYAAIVVSARARTRTSAVISHRQTWTYPAIYSALDGFDWHTYIVVGGKPTSSGEAHHSLFDWWCHGVESNPEQRF